MQDFVDVSEILDCSINISPLSPNFQKTSGFKEVPLRARREVLIMHGRVKRCDFDHRDAQDLLSATRLYQRRSPFQLHVPKWLL